MIPVTGSAQTPCMRGCFLTGSPAINGTQLRQVSSVRDAKHLAYSCWNTLLFHRFTASPLHRFTASPLHRFTASPLHRFTASPLHRFTTKGAASFSPGMPSLGECFPGSARNRPGSKPNAFATYNARQQRLRRTPLRGQRAASSKTHDQRLYLRAIQATCFFKNSTSPCATRVTCLAVRSSLRPPLSSKAS